MNARALKILVPTKLLPLLLLLALPAVTQAQFTYTTNNNAITITGDTNIPVNGVVVIPGTINGLPVTVIGEGAFGSSTVTSVTIPNSITNIEQLAFRGCGILASVALGTNVISIGASAFQSCSNLANITIPNTVTSLGDSAFVYCARLMNVTIGTGITSIGQKEFYESGLTSVTIPTSVTNIGYGAFGFSQLTNAAIPASVTTIAGGAFFCYTLTSYTVDSNNLFYSSLNGVLFNKSQTTLAAYPAGAVGNYVIPSGVTNIGASGFNGCTNLMSVTIPDSFKSIGYEAFEYFYGLTNVTIPASVTSIGAYAFAATGLTSVTIPDGVSSIGQVAFGSCYNLTSVEIPASVTNIGVAAFLGGNTTVSVDSGNPAYASVAGILFNKSLTTLIQYPVGSAAQSYTVPNKVTEIGPEAFFYCTSLTNVTFPTSITSIDADAFYGCTSLTSVYFQGSAPLDVATEFGNDHATIYYLPGTTGWGVTFGGLTTVPWTLPYPLILSSGPSFGVLTNRFGFIASWATNVSVVVEGSTNLNGPVWQPLQTNTLANGYFYFSDPNWTNYHKRFYRLRL